MFRNENSYCKVCKKLFARVWLRACKQKFLACSIVKERPKTVRYVFCSWFQLLWLILIVDCLYVVFNRFRSLRLFGFFVFCKNPVSLGWPTSIFEVLMYPPKTAALLFLLSAKYSVPSLNLENLEKPLYFLSFEKTFRFNESCAYMIIIGPADVYIFFLYRSALFWTWTLIGWLVVFFICYNVTLLADLLYFEDSFV